MLNVFICEDNDVFRNNMEECIKKIIDAEKLDLRVSLSTENPYNVLEYIKEKNMCGIYFLDIDLKSDINGIELAEKIRKYDPRGFIVFVTTHAEMSYLTFLYKVEAMDYIVKDNYEVINQRIKECILNAYKKFYIKSSKVSPNFNIKSGEKFISVKLDDILFFETSDTIHKVILHCKNRQIEFYSKMKDIEKELDSRFFRCHRSFIINKNNLEKVDIENRIVYMNNNEQCLVSSRLLKPLIKNIDMNIYK